MQSYFYFSSQKKERHVKICLSFIFFFINSKKADARNKKIQAPIILTFHKFQPFTVLDILWSCITKKPCPVNKSPFFSHKRTITFYKNLLNLIVKTFLLISHFSNLRFNLLARSGKSVKAL